ncbi:MAG: hypothetical protein KDH99_03765 [Alcanivoracaceae bacterium]|nr:hypothetical protein [Alcanivoracaceae bacterium]
MRQEDHTRSLRSHRYRGILTGAIMGLVACALLYLGLMRALAIGMLVVSTLLLATAMVLPACHRYLTAGLERIGVLLTGILVVLTSALVYYAVITPVALAGRAFRRDELDTRKPGQDSNWRPADAGISGDEYFRRQY